MNAHKKKPFPLAEWIFLLYTGSLAFLAGIMLPQHYQVLLSSLQHQKEIFYNVIYFFSAGLFVFFYLAGAITLIMVKPYATKLIIASLFFNVLLLAERIFLPTFLWDEPMKKEYLIHAGTIANILINSALLYYFSKQRSHSS